MIYLEDIDPVFKISRKVKTDLHDLPVPIFSKKIIMSAFRDVDSYKHNMFRKIIGIVPGFSKYLGVPKNRNSWLWGSGTRPKIPKS